MDIKRAKKEIKDSIEAYLAKDEFGDYFDGASGNRKDPGDGAGGERV